MSRPTPEFIAMPEKSDALASLLDQSPASSLSVDLKAEMMKPLPDMEESNTKRVGFFEQGFFSGLTVVGLTAVSTVFVCAWRFLPGLAEKVPS
jgi:hypothetical protein